jgi:hypothetical protein
MHVTDHLEQLGNRARGAFERAPDLSARDKRIPYLRWKNVAKSSRLDMLSL